MPKTSTTRGTCLVQQSRPFHILQSSLEFAAYFGYELHELHGRSLKLLQHPDCGSVRIEDLIKALKSGKLQDCEVNVSKKDCSQSRIKIRVSTTNISDKDKDAVAMITLEDSDRFECIEGDEQIDSLPDTLQESLNTDAARQPSLQQHLKVQPSCQSSEPASVVSRRDEEMLSCLLSRQSCKVCKISLSHASVNDLTW